MNSNPSSFVSKVAQLAVAGGCLLPSLACQAQGIVDCVIQGKVRTPLVRGIVVDPTGVPVPDTLVILEANDEIVEQTKTNTHGNFNLKASSGAYRFKVTHPQFTGVALDLVVGKDVSNAFSRNWLYAVLGLPGSFCPMVWTNSNKLHRMIDANKRQLQETTQNNATQK